LVIISVRGRGNQWLLDQGAQGQVPAVANKPRVSIDDDAATQVWKGTHSTVTKNDYYRSPVDSPFLSTDLRRTARQTSGIKHGRYEQGFPGKGDLVSLDTHYSPGSWPSK